MYNVMNNCDDRFYLFPGFNFNYTFVNTTDIVLAMALLQEAGSRQRLRIATDRAMLRHIARSLQPVEKPLISSLVMTCVWVESL